MASSLAEYLKVLRSRWRWLVWGMLLALLATAAFFLVDPPLYRSEATVFVRTPGDVSRVLDGGDSYARGRAKTYAALAGNISVSTRVVSDLGLDLEPEVLSKRISATNPAGTALITVTVSAPSAAEAQRTAYVLLSEYAETVRTLESVPGSVVPRAELVVVSPPGEAVRVIAGGLPIPVVLAATGLIGLLLGALGAVLRSIFESLPDQLSELAPTGSIASSLTTAANPRPTEVVPPAADRESPSGPVIITETHRHRQLRTTRKSARPPGDQTSS